MNQSFNFSFPAVDGSEILHQLIGSLSVYLILYRLLYISGGDRRISEASTVKYIIPPTFKGYTPVN